jgi:hypothetical protein
LRAKVAVAVEACSGLWCESFDDLDWDKKAVRLLIEAVCTVGGFDLPVDAMAVAS